MLEQWGIRAIQRLQLLLQALHGIEGRVLGWLALPGFRHARRGQAGEAGAQVELHQLFVCGPGAELVEPRFEVTGLHLAAVDLLGGQRITADLPQFLGPLRPGRLEPGQLLATLLQRCLDQRRRLWPVLLGAHATEQRADPRQQGVGAAPVATHPGQRIALHAVAEAPPVVAHDLTQQLAVVGFQGLGEQAAAVEGMFAQHALAPAVNGRHRSLVHPLHGDFQAAGTTWPGFFRVVVTQLVQQRVGRLQLATEEPRSFGQARTDTFTQFLGGGVGEGHHEDLRW